MGKALRSTTMRENLPVLVGLTCGMVVYSQLGIGQVVKIDGTAPPPGIKAETLEYTNLISATRMLITGGAIGLAMAIFIVIMSGAWPYVKLWRLFNHVRKVEEGRETVRECRHVLELLELLGKWSYTDVFLICFNAVIFRIFTEKHHIGLLGSLEIQLWSELRFPAAALIIAICATSGLTHWAVSELWPKGFLVPDEEDTPLVSSQSDSSDDEASDAEIAADEHTFSRAALAAALAAILCLLLSMCFPLLTVYRGGFLGLLIAEPDRDLKLSVFSLSSMMWRSAFEKGGTWYSMFFAVTLVNMGCIVPLIELVLLAASATFTLTGREFNSRMSRCGAGWFHSFACADMLSITCLMLVAALPTLVKINMGNQCEAFEFLLSNKLILSIIGLGDAASPDCLTVNSRLEIGWYLLTLSCGLRALVRFCWFLGSSVGVVYGTAPDTPKASRKLERMLSSYVLSDLTHGRSAKRFQGAVAAMFRATAAKAKATPADAGENR